MHGQTVRAKGRFETLDGMRGIAAILVLAFHACVTAGCQPSPLPSAFLAVDLFFMISGFVLAFRYEQQLRARGGYRSFVRERLLRLYPLALLGAGLGAMVAMAKALYPAPDRWEVRLVAENAVLAAGFVPRLFGGNTLFAFPLNEPAWSLFFELAINLLWAPLIPWLTMRRLIAVTGVGALTLVASAVFWGTLETGWGNTNFLGGFARVLFAFPAGVLIHRLWQRGSFDALPRISASLLVGSLLIVSVLPSAGILGATLDVVVVIAVFPALVALAVDAGPHTRIAPIFALSAEISYPLYAVHVPLLKWGVCVAQAVGLAIGVAVPITALLAFPAALLALRYWDKPLRRRLKPLLSRRTAGMPDTTRPA